jgi:hypothetical protein
MEAGRWEMGDGSVKMGDGNKRKTKGINFNFI